MMRASDSSGDGVDAGSPASPRPPNRWATREDLDALETIEVDPLWCLVLEGFDPTTERIRSAIASLAGGRVGVSGATLACHAGERRWALASGVYAITSRSGPLWSAPRSWKTWFSFS